MKIGAKVSKPDFDDARNRLLATGAFESVSCGFKPSADNAGYDGVFEVIEVEQVFPYRFEELPVPDKELRAALAKQEPLMGDRIPGSQEVIARYVKAIQAVVGPNVKVAGSLSSDLPDQPMVIFRPDRPRDRVAEVHFKGNQVLPTALLQRTFAEAAVGAVFTDTTMHLLLDSSIRPLYEARGRLKVAFPSIEGKPAPLIDGLIVTVTVDEGPSYSLGDVKFSGVGAAEMADVKKAANVQTADVANFDDVKAGLERVLNRYRAHGYLHVTGRTDRQINDAEHKIDVTLTIEPGAQYTMGKLNIEGLDINTEPTIRRVWGLKTGAPFTPSYPDAFLNGIREQQVLDNLGKTLAETHIDEKTRVVDVTLYFGGTQPDQKTRREKKQPPLF